MIKIISSNPSYLTQLVKLGFARSVPNNLVDYMNIEDPVSDGMILVCCGLSNDEIDTVYQKVRGFRTKLVIFGRLSAYLMSRHNLCEVDDIDFDSLTFCPPALPNQVSISAGQIHYHQHETISNFKRPLCRFDYAEEWNNLGFGRICAEGIFALSRQILKPNNFEVASLLHFDDEVGCYGVTIDEDDCGILWIGRSLGSLDGHDWIIAEEFISNHRAEDLPCVPVLSEIPFGYNGAVTMRLDCDEDIESAEPLMNLYQTRDIPLSLAITTKLLSDNRHQNTIERILEMGGGVLSHSHSHAPHWGGSYETALNEAVRSKDLLFSALQKSINHVVAPFHHASAYALSALSDAGYTACIGGVMNANPEFVLARSGFVSDEHSLIGMTQQCMLHGHTISKDSNPAETFKKSFDLSLKCKRFHGYLDHPFSSRYQYDWLSEEQRVYVHNDLINYMTSHDNILFLNENNALDFLIARAHANYDLEENVIKYHVNPPENLAVAWQLKGKTYKAN